MKVIILAGGLGTRLSEETVLKPKPMVEIGNHPIMWHIMKIYSTYGFKEFICTLGYKGEYIRNYFLNYKNSYNDISINLKTNDIKAHYVTDEDWLIHLIDTGLTTLTGGRIKKAMKFAGKESIMATYGDGLANINIKELLKFHHSHGKLATLTAVRPPSRFGSLNIENNKVVKFEEKPQIGEGWINGGFFVFQPEVFDYIESDDIEFEKIPLEILSKEGQLMAYTHQGFWHPMDVVRDKKYLQELWTQKKAPWKIW